MTDILTIIAPIAVMAIGLLFQETIKSLISKHISNLSKSQVSSYFFLLLIGATLTSVALIQTGAYVIDSGEKSVTIESEKIEPEKPKTEAQVYTEALDTLVDIVGEMAENKRLRDSSKIANRPRFWVYKFGTLKSKRAALALYEGLKSLEGVCLFQEDRKNYLVILIQANTTESGLRANISLLQNSLNINETIDVIDLASLCSSRKEITETDPVEYDGGAIKCYRCVK